MSAKVPADVDLVMVEYGVNDLIHGNEVHALANPDNQMYTVERKALERLYRRMLLLPSRPALLLFEAYAWGAKHSEHGHGGRCLGGSGACCVWVGAWGPTNVLCCLCRKGIHALAHACLHVCGCRRACMQL